MHLSENAAQEEVVLAKVFIEHGRVGVGVEVSVGGVLEETTVGVECRFEQLPDELAKQTATVDARLVHARKVDELHLHAALQVRFCKTKETDQDSIALHSLSFARRSPFSTESLSKASSYK